MKSAIDQMPAEVATTLLLSGQSMTNRFRKVCKAARERICEPVSRSTMLNFSAPKTGEQRLRARLGKATAKQLHVWARRAKQRGNILQDALFEAQAAGEEKLATLLQIQIQALDTFAQAANTELTSRSTRGIGYRKPVKFKKL